MLQYMVLQRNEGQRITYGITLLDNGEEVDSIGDVLPNRQQTAGLAAMLQEHGVAAEHFRDVVADCLNK